MLHDRMTTVVQQRRKTTTTSSSSSSFIKKIHRYSLQATRIDDDKENKSNSQRQQQQYQRLRHRRHATGREQKRLPWGTITITVEYTIAIVNIFIIIIIVINHQPSTTSPMTQRCSNAPDDNDRINDDNDNEKTTAPAIANE